MATMNAQQQEAVDCLDGALLILAGAGTGKTTVIVHRIENLVRHGVSPKSILAVTFTNKAAREMRDRISAAIGKNGASAMTISTFHAYCIRILHQFIDKLGYSRNFTLAPESYRSGLITEIINKGGQARISGDSSFWMHAIGMAKAAAKTPDDIRAEGYAKSNDVADVYEEYQERMRQMDLLDFDDLLCLTVQLWKKYPHVLEACQNAYKYIMVDEFQDTNDVQMQLVTMLSRSHGNIAVVGDDDQSIYGWRGANIKNIQDFQRAFPQAKLMRLEQNYRSTNVILKSANKVISKNPQRLGKVLWSDKGDGEKIMAIRLQDEAQEAKFIADYIHDNGRDGKWNRFAVLYRSNSQSRLVEEALRKARVPYTMVGSRSFYQTKEILDAIAYLQVLLNPRDDLSFLRIVNVPPRGIGATSLERLRKRRDSFHMPLQELLRQDSTFDDLPEEACLSLRKLRRVFGEYRDKFKAGGNLRSIARDFYTAVGYMDGFMAIYRKREDAEKRQDNVYEFLNSLQDYQDRNPQGNLSGFMEYVSLFDSSDDEKKNDEKGSGNTVTCMTVHAAKGLEFDTVCICGMEKNLFPHQRAMEEGNETEERRLFYVGITRAKRQLLLTFAGRRRERMTSVARLPSMFLDEIPEEFIEYKKPDEVFKPVSAEDMSAMFARFLKK